MINSMKIINKTDPPENHIEDHQLPSNLTLKFLLQKLINSWSRGIVNSESDDENKKLRILKLNYFGHYLICIKIGFSVISLVLIYLLKMIFSE